MIKNPRNRFLYAPEGVETPTSAGLVEPGAATGKQTAEANAGGTPAAQRKPGRLEMISASIKDKGGLMAQVNDLTGQVSTLTAENTRLKGELATATQQLTAVRGELAEVDQALAGARSEMKTAEALAVDIAASQGVPAAALPAPLIPGASETVADLEAKMEATKDPKERWRIQEKIEALEAKGA